MNIDSQRVNENITQEEYDQMKKKYETENLSQFPSVFQQARNLAKQILISGIDKAKGRPLLASPEKAAARMDICAKCEFLKENRCTKCGCYINTKIQVESAGCPINKWGEELQKLYSENDVKALLRSPERKNLRVDLQQLPKEDADKMIKYAEHALDYDGRFGFKDKQYKATMGADNVLQITEVQKLPPMAQRAHDMSVSNPRDQVRFHELILKHQKPDMPKIFSFKKFYFHLVPRSNKNGFMIYRVDPNNIPPDFPSDIKLPPLQD